MGIASTIGTAIIGIIALIIIISVIFFFVKLLAPLFLGLIVLALIIGAGIWIFTRLKIK
jgi:hypothetical protein